MGPEGIKVFLFFSPSPFLFLILMQLAKDLYGHAEEQNSLTQQTEDAQFNGKISTRHQKNS